jgi:DNA repair protein RecO (recombination protein O)
MIVKDEAIILRSIDFGETSKIITAFTRRFGKMSLIAKGMRNPKSKLFFASQPLSILEITFYDKNKNGLHLLSTAANLITLNKIFSSFEHLTYGMMIIESLYQTLIEHNPLQDMFDYTKETIQMINQLDCEPFSLFVASQFKLAEVLGFWLQFDFMLDEFATKSSTYAFSIEDGCPILMSKADKNKFVFDFNSALYLQTIFKKPLVELTKVSPPKSSINKIVSFFEKYFSFHLEKNFFYDYFSLLSS